MMVSKPVIRLMVVVLPEPLGPISPRISPRLRAKLTSLTACNPPKSLVRSRISSRSSGETGAGAAIESGCLPSLHRLGNGADALSAPLLDRPPVTPPVAPTGTEPGDEGWLAIHDLEDERLLVRGVPTSASAQSSWPLNRSNSSSSSAFARAAPSVVPARSIPWAIITFTVSQPMTTKAVSGALPYSS